MFRIATDKMIAIGIISKTYLILNEHSLRQINEQNQGETSITTLKVNDNSLYNIQ